MSVHAFIFMLASACGSSRKPAPTTSGGIRGAVFVCRGESIEARDVIVTADRTTPMFESIGQPGVLRCEELTASGGDGVCFP